MTLDAALAPELAAAQGTWNMVEAAEPARHSPLAGELAARLGVIAGLWRRLAEERMALSNLLERAAIGFQARQAEVSIARDRPGDAESPKRLGGGERGRGKGVAVPNHDVAEGERRLATAGDVGENTRRAYESALRGLDAWLRECRPGEAPNDSALADYLAVLAARGRCVSSAAHVVAAVKRRARQQSSRSPVGERTAEALRRYRRVARAGPDQVRGISWEEADRMRDLAASAGDVRGLRDAALISVASDALLRVSEVSNVQVDDIVFEDDGSARLLLRRSKTDRQGRGALLFLGPRTAELVREWAAAGGVKQGPLFRRIHRAGSVASQGIGAARYAGDRSAGSGGGCRRACVWPLSAGWFSAIAGEAPCGAGGDAECGTLGVTGHARPLHAVAGSGGRRGRPLAPPTRHKGGAWAADRKRLTGRERSG